MILCTNFDIKRLKKDVYVVTANGNDVADFKSFQEAQNFIFNTQAKELMGKRLPRVEKDTLTKAA